MALPASPPSNERHISVCGMWYVCDICGEDLDEKEPVVALAGNASSTAFKAGFINPFGTAPASELWEAKYGKWQICRSYRSDCWEHFRPVRPGSVVHPDCLQVFMRNCSAEDALDRLYQTCVWRCVPWVGAKVPEVRLALRPVWRWLDSFLLCAENNGLPALRSLPHVALGIIMESLPRNHLFWRYVSALDLARRLSDSQLQPLRIVPLDRLVSWERGAAPELVSEDSSDTLPPVIRLTIDYEGLMRFERLAERPGFSRQRFDNRAFVVEEEDLFNTTVAKFKNGLLQLAMADSNDAKDPVLAFWDTPTPLNLNQHPIRPVPRGLWLTFHTIDLSAITGITLFLDGSSLFAIHPHTQSQPCAMSTYAAMKPHHTMLSWGPLVQRSDLGEWLVPNDRHRSWPSFLIRTRLSGEVVIGRNRESERHNYAYFLNASDQLPRTLVYSIRSQSSFLDTSVFAALNVDGVQAGRIEGRPAYPPADVHPTMQHSYAPLGNVARVRVFYLPNSRTCMGVLLYYDNGGQRALGQCRLHVYPSETYIRPSSIAFVKWPLSIPVGEWLSSMHSVEGICSLYQKHEARDARVQFNGTGRQDGRAWFHYAMTGTLDCWFTPSSMELSLTINERLIQ
ncbi:uncharacterized protein B0H64DRAFT_434797 [Chaetomium fimeti]|uniref:Uncharacterized protein n=1 Tax=Chaetomium fimeti TaxID=1854472 RepID=A0AAE0HDM3_9PEZI|nr:hypothetical protein B0H64DRAFT_434797 [Chaetomium fimeti]